MYLAQPKVFCSKTCCVLFGYILNLNAFSMPITSFLTLHLHRFYNYSRAVNAISIRDFMDLATTYVRIVGLCFSRIWEIVVHRKPLRFRQFSHELLMLSHEHRLYLVRQPCLLRSTHFPPLGGTSLRRNSR